MLTKCCNGPAYAAVAATAQPLSLDVILSNKEQCRKCLQRIQDSGLRTPRTFLVANMGIDHSGTHVLMPQKVPESS